MFKKEWRLNGQVHENYNALTELGDDVTSSDRFYHWEALLGLIDHSLSLFTNEPSRSL